MKNDAATAKPTQHTKIKHIIAAIMVALATFYLRLNLYDDGGDLIWPLCASRLLLTGQNPYDAACLIPNPDGGIYAVYPITTVLATMPFSWLNDTIAATIIVSIGAGLLAYGLVQRGGLGMLFVFTSFSTLEAIHYAQWSFLIAAIGFLPFLYPLTMVKPHLAMPVVITAFTWRRMLITGAIGLLSLILFPNWIWDWLHLTTTYDGNIPLLTLSGILLMPLLFFWRNQDVRYLLLAALAPQRAMYDTMILTGALRSGIDAIVWSLSTWLVLLVCFRLGIDLPNRHAIAAYLPMAILVGIRAFRSGDLRTAKKRID